MQLDFANVLSVFMVLFAVIDITGSIPVLLDIKSKGNEIQAGKATLVAMAFMFIFLFGGNGVLNLFGVDIASFAIAGALVLFAIAVEMIMGVELFKNNIKGSASIVPVAFPLIAGAGSMTTLIALRAEYSLLEIIIAVLLNMLIVFIVLRYTHFFEKLLGEVGMKVLQKFFGVILLAISVKLFVSNLAEFINKILPQLENISH